MAYNEEKNIASILSAMEGQILSSCDIEEIIVVSSGSTDDTDKIVRSFEKNPKIRLFSQKTREGKASAINLFIKESKGEVLVLESADTIPAPMAVENLVAPFKNPDVGMTGARPNPVDSGRSFMGYCTQFLWWMHHKLATENPKLGEMVAFRNTVKKIPNDTAVDEACIEAIISEQGLKALYVPDAVVKNKGPDSVSDFLKQRRRISAGHYHLQQTRNYAASSMSNSVIIAILLSKIKEHLRRIVRMVRRGYFRRLFFYISAHMRPTIFALGAMFLEVYGRLLGIYDFKIKKKNPYKWDIASSTKKMIR